MMITREIQEGMQLQGIRESIGYRIEASPWTGAGATLTSLSVAVYDQTAGSTVTSTVMPSGSPTASGTIITLPNLTGLTADHIYKIDIIFHSSGNIFDGYMFVKAET